MTSYDPNLTDPDGTGPNGTGPDGTGAKGAAHGPHDTGTNTGTKTGPDTAEAFAEAKAHVMAVVEAARAFMEHATAYASARRDLALVYTRKLLLGAALLSVVLFVLAVFLGTAVVLACLGLALALAAAFGSVWAGVLVTGFGLLILTAVLLMAAVKWVTASKRKATLARYGAQDPSSAQPAAA